MAKTMKTTQKSTKNDTLTIGAYDSSSAGKAYKLTFRTGVHTDKKKQARKNACRGKNFSL